MKSSLGKLRKFALQDHKGGVEGKERRDHPFSSAHSNELAQASLDMQDMRNCYDSLLSAAAATANSAYEFSESLRDLGTCLREKTLLNDDEESSNLLSTLGHVQLELQKLFDSYRSLVVMTISTPSESLLNELRTVEEMKRQCDEKRSLYEHMMSQQREKGRSKSGKMEVFSSQQLQAACDEYNEEATLCAFRLKSLKQGQCRSLITQAARHHAAQLNFFRKGVKSLEAVEPHMRRIAEKQHIDYELTGLDDGEDEGVDSFESTDDCELSFDNRLNKRGHDAVLTSRNSMELDQADVPHFQVQKNSETVNRVPRTASYSAPIFAEKKLDPSERVRDMQPTTTQKSYSYVLPTPDDARGILPARSSYSSASQSRPTKQSRSSQNLWHSSQLEAEMHERVFTDDNLSVLLASKARQKKELSSSKPSGELPPASAKGVSRPHSDASSTYDNEKVKRQAFSGPLTGMSSSSIKPASSVGGPITPSELPQLVSGLISRVPTYQAPLSSPPRVSPSASPPIVSSPRISELHELPRPPDGLASKLATSSSGHSAPLGSRNRELSPRNRSSGSGAFSTTSPLPTPPTGFPRCFSIPSSNQRSIAKQLLESSRQTGQADEVASPPLTPISLYSVKLVPNVSQTAPDSEPINEGISGLRRSLGIVLRGGALLCG